MALNSFCRLALNVFLLLLRQDLITLPWLFWNSLCRPGWPENCRDHLVSTSQVQGLKVCVPIPGTYLALLNGSSRHHILSSGIIGVWETQLSVLRDLFVWQSLTYVTSASLELIIGLELATILPLLLLNTRVTGWIQIIDYSATMTCFRWSLKGRSWLDLKEVF